MADHSTIEWTEATWNPIVGCDIFSPGCTNCYAMGMAARIEAMTAALRKQGKAGAPHYDGTTRRVKGKAVWTGKLALAPETILTEPLSWKRPRKIFVNSMGDLFHEAVPDEWIDRVFAVMALAPQHTFQVLTKRAQRMRQYMDVFAGREMVSDRVQCAMWEISERRTDHFHGGWPLRNVWLGVSTEDQARADERIPDLLDTPAAIRFVSAEPLLGPIDFYMTSDAMPVEGHPWRNGPILQGIDWIIVGGESGSDARPMHPDWARSIRDQCAAAGVAFFFKQWGSWSPVTIAEDDDGNLGPAYPMAGCADPSAHAATQEALFWQGDRLVHWPLVKTETAVGVRHVGKSRAGRMLDGREHSEFPQPPRGDGAMKTLSKAERIADANYLLLTISMFGRRFFYSHRHNRVARFEMTIDGKLWFRDDYTDKRIYVAYRGRWRHFSHGGTMRRLIDDLANYIRTGERIRAGHFGPWPEYICDGDLWGYGKETMETLRTAMWPRDCVAWPSKAEAA